MEKIYDAIMDAMIQQDKEIKQLREDLTDLINCVAKQNETMLFAFVGGTIKLVLKNYSSEYSVRRIDFTPMTFSSSYGTIFRIIFGDHSAESLRNTLLKNDAESYKALVTFTTIFRGLYGYASVTEGMRLQELFVDIVQDSFDQMYGLVHGLITCPDKLLSQLETVINVVPDDLKMLLGHIKIVPDQALKKIIITRIEQLLPGEARMVFFIDR